MVASDYIYSVINAVTMSLHPWSLLLNLFNRSSRSFVHQSACSNKIFISPAQVDTVLAKAQAYSPPGSPSCTVAPIWAPVCTLQLPLNHLISENVNWDRYSMKATWSLLWLIAPVVWIILLLFTVFTVFIQQPLFLWYWIRLSNCFVLLSRFHPLIFYNFSFILYCPLWGS